MKLVKTIILLILITSFAANTIVSNQARAANRDCWALIIGISDYQYINDLDYAHNDANELAETLINYHGWSESQIYKLIDSQATKTNILDHITRIAAQEDSDDLFLLFFAGHGSQAYDKPPYDEDDGYDEYLIPYDCDLTTPTAISDDELKESLSNLESNMKVVILDTCYSGGFVRTAGLKVRSIRLNDSPPEGSMVQRESTSRDLNLDGFVTLASCDEDELAFETPELENGLFTYYLIEGLGPNFPADANLNNMVSAEEVFSYASPRTTAFEPAQHPQIYDGVVGEAELGAVIKIPVSDADLDVLNSPEGSVYFIYPDHMGVKAAGVRQASLSDWTAAGYVIGMCSNIQNEATDTNPQLIDLGTGAITLEDKIVILFGGPVVNSPVHYYEKNRIAPLYFGTAGGACYWYRADGTRLDETALTFTELKSGQDMFVVEALMDSSGNKVLIIYGYEWRGTFAGGKFFKFIIYPNISSYTDSYYIFKWMDENGNSFVDLDEISEIPISHGY